MPILDPTLIRIAAVIAKTMHDPGLIAHIRAETTWDDLNADSLDRAEIYFEIECEFECELTDGVCEVVNTIGDLAALVDKAKARVSA
jgi:acyl carrier protein